MTVQLLGVMQYYLLVGIYLFSGAHAVHNIDSTRGQDSAQGHQRRIRHSMEADQHDVDSQRLMRRVDSQHLPPLGLSKRRARRNSASGPQGSVSSDFEQYVKHQFHPAYAVVVGRWGPESTVQPAALSALGSTELTSSLNASDMEMDPSPALRPAPRGLANFLDYAAMQTPVVVAAPAAVAAPAPATVAAPAAAAPTVVKAATPGAAPAVVAAAPAVVSPVTAAPVVAAAGAVVTTGAPVVAQPAAEGGTNWFLIIFLFIIVPWALILGLYVYTKMNAAARGANPGRLDSVQTDPESTQVWKTSKARHTYRKSVLAAQAEKAAAHSSDEDQGGKSNPVPAASGGSAPSTEQEQASKPVRSTRSGYGANRESRRQQAQAEDTVDSNANANANAEGEEVPRRSRRQRQAEAAEENDGGDAAPAEPSRSTRSGYGAARESRRAAAQQSF